MYTELFQQILSAKLKQMKSLSAYGNILGSGEKNRPTTDVPCLAGEELVGYGGEEFLRMGNKLTKIDEGVYYAYKIF